MAAILMALDILRHPQWGDESDIREAVVCAIKALEKQLPKKPDTEITNRGIDITGEYDIDSYYICPVCKCVIGDCEKEDYWYKFCPDCGQALDWSDEQ